MWDKKNNCIKKDHPLFREYSIYINDKILEAEKILMEYENKKKYFSSDQLKGEMQKKKSTELSVFKCFELFIERMKQAGQIKNSLIYKDGLRQLKHFTLQKDIHFHQINISFLNKYEEYMRKNELSSNTIYLYLRTLRALINKSIKENYCDPELYPFRSFSLTKYYKIKTVKRAISKEDLLKIEKLDLEKGSSLLNSRNIFLFSYYNR